MNEAALFLSTEYLMLFFYPMFTLMIDILNVIDMRLRLIAAGKSTPDEIFLMVNEKVEAFEEARAILMRGGHPDLGQLPENSRRERRPFVGLNWHPPV
jgi:hypothetical protein